MDKLMDAININRLRIAANQFYLNKYKDQPQITDAEYDKLVLEYEAESGSVKDLIEFDKGIKVKNTLPIGLNKVAVSDNNLENAVNSVIMRNNLTENYLNFKYDGGSIIGFYRDGKLQEVRSTPDEAIGIIRTKVFWNIFPHRIEDKSIIAIQGEALVDWTAYGQKARNKANGLLNSVNMDEEAERELFVRVYKVYFNDADPKIYDHKRSHTALQSLPFITRIRKRLGADGELHEFKDLVFATSYEFTPEDCPTDPLTDIIRVHDNVQFHDKFQVDGVVMYASTEAQGFVQGFKFYYTESAITTITRVVWSKASSGSYQPKLNFKTVTLNDKRIAQAASGGYPNLKSMKMGKGAKVRVILSKMTIPKIIEVLEPSEDYELPTCGCGHQLDPTMDLFGSGLKCTELDCSERYNSRTKALNDWILSKVPKDQTWRKEDILKAGMFSVVNIVLNIDRWDSKGKCRNKNVTSEMLYNDIKNLYQFPHASEDFKQLMQEYFTFPGLCTSILSINYVTADRVISDVFNSIT